ncbi:hypothetical protein NADFUDRAFT_82571 [Nadsonia fulvescens var. elongata DSM 6958]|uniref:Subtilisin-like protein n=1 Tax=Nadsonia fulvescens var. elongata DSM 6958 TaxID=857566 RepID=A0A1E3PKP3_9ASCO|nr:hypothetical protein NADFUDRAFT_82571 [Nadsonia fulvescens var. elongata DSM 6958]
MKFNVVAIAAILPLLATALVIPSPADIAALPSLAAWQLRHTLTSPSDNGLAPVVAHATDSTHAAIADSYIIVLRDDLDEQAVQDHCLWVNAHHDDTITELSRRSGAQDPFLAMDAGIKHVFDGMAGFRGYAGKFHPFTLDAIRRHPNVAFIEMDSVVHTTGDLEVEKNAPWGLARISNRDTLSLGNFNKYLYNTDGGEGVTAYVIDTGTNIKHVDFEGRASWGKTVPVNDEDLDGNGHGTHCSGTIAGKEYGVAKKANVVAVKVLRSNGSGSMSDVLKGVEFAASSHLKAVKENKKGFKGSTANMSLGGGSSPSLDLAVNAAVNAGIHFAVAAGNDNADACSYSPAAAKNAVTVAASTLSDSRAYFSNYGKCVDIFAPGLNIQSTYIGSDHAVATLSGTSMASPHVCGLLSYFLSLQPSSDSEFASAGAITPAEMKKHLVAFGTAGTLSDVDKDTPNVLIYNGGHGNLTKFWSLDEEIVSAGQADKDGARVELDLSWGAVMGKVGSWF